jgi:hypothetical protein
MPSGWMVDTRREITKASHELSVGDSAVIVFIADDDLSQKPTQEFIHRYRNSEAARGVYDDFIHPAGDAPFEWMYESPVAEESQIACYDYEGREPYPICEWAARYEEYIVEVHSWLITGRMSLQDLDNVIRAVDVRMAHYLGKSFPEVTIYPTSPP